MNNKEHSQAATVAGVIAIALWCWSGPCFGAGSRVMGAMPYLALSCVVGVITGMILHRIQGHRLTSLFRLPIKVVIAGFFGVAVYTVILVMAVGMAEDKDIGQVVLVNYLWPVWMILLSIALLKDKPKALPAICGAILGLGGVVVSRGLETFTAPPASLLPHGMALVGAFWWALYSVLLKRWRVPEENCGATLQFVFCGLLAAVVGCFQGQWRQMPQLTLPVIFWILFLGVGPIGIAYYFWEIGIKRGSSHLLAVLAYFIPVVSAVLVGLLFRESLSIGLIPGALMITAGAFLSRCAR